MFIILWMGQIQTNKDPCLYKIFPSYILYKQYACMELVTYLSNSFSPYIFNTSEVELVSTEK